MNRKMIKNLEFKTALQSMLLFVLMGSNWEGNLEIRVIMAIGCAAQTAIWLFFKKMSLSWLKTWRFFREILQTFG